MKKKQYLVFCFGFLCSGKIFASKNPMKLSKDKFYHLQENYENSIEIFREPNNFNYEDMDSKVLNSSDYPFYSSLELNSLQENEEKIFFSLFLKTMTIFLSEKNQKNIFAKEDHDFKKILSFSSDILERKIENFSYYGKVKENIKSVLSHEEYKLLINYSFLFKNTESMFINSDFFYNIQKHLDNNFLKLHGKVMEFFHTSFAPQHTEENDSLYQHVLYTTKETKNLFRGLMEIVNPAIIFYPENSKIVDIYIKKNQQNYKKKIKQENFFLNLYNVFQEKKQCPLEGKCILDQFFHIPCEDNLFGRTVHKLLYNFAFFVQILSFLYYDGEKIGNLLNTQDPNIRFSGILYHDFGVDSYEECIKFIKKDKKIRYKKIKNIPGKTQNTPEEIQNATAKEAMNIFLNTLEDAN